MGVVAADVRLADLHPEMMKEIAKHGPQMVFNNRSNMAKLAAENGSPLAEGLRKEADQIARTYNLGST